MPGTRIVGVLPLQADGTYTFVGLFVLLLLAGATGYWTYIDGTDRGIKRAPWWGAGVFWLLLLGVLPGLVALALYLSKRPSNPS